MQLVGAPADPALDVRRPPGGDRPLEHLVGEPVDLEEEDAGDVRAAEPLPLPRLGADDVAVPALVVVDRQQRRGRRGRDGEEQRDDDRLGEPRHLGVGDEVDREGHQGGIDDDRCEAEGEDVERQGEPRQGREYERVEDADQERDADRSAEAVEREALEDPGQDPEHDGVDRDHRRCPPQGLQRVGEDVRCGPRIHVDGESSRIPRRGGRFA